MRWARISFLAVCGKKAPAFALKDQAGKTHRLADYAGRPVIPVDLLGHGTADAPHDPAFVADGESRTVAEMSAAEKDAISHRARAAAALRPQLPAE